MVAHQLLSLLLLLIIVMLGYTGSLTWESVFIITAYLAVTSHLAGIAYGWSISRKDLYLKILKKPDTTARKVYIGLTTAGMIFIPLVISRIEGW